MEGKGNTRSTHLNFNSEEKPLLYKFKSATKRDINDLQEDRLWVSTLGYMNDPTDLGFYLKNKSNIEDIVEFQDSINRSIVVASFSTVAQSRRLWNYYSNGMKGFVLAYKPDVIVGAFGRLGDKICGRAYRGKVAYGTKKYDLTADYEKYQNSKEIPNVNKDFLLLFQKDVSWAEENEYRIAMTIRHGNTEAGFHLQRIRPDEVIIGYRMSKAKIKKINKWCIENNITLRKYIPDFWNEKSDSPFQDDIIAKDGIQVRSPF